ncbi:MAG: IPT/TIG domain-containing protein [Candidatus Bathyarchaeota archaeon]|nr:IPT/TIG domain-containing protein [Candidatus Bathyarchaeota archaeon]
MPERFFLHKENLLVAVFICIIGLTALSTHLVRARPVTVDVSPSSGSFGTTVTVSGDDATPNGEVRVYIGTFANLFAATTNANSTGGYSTHFTIPTLPFGPYKVLVLDVETENTNTASALFIVEPAITLRLEEGSCGDEVTVEGHGFNATSPITLGFDGTNVTPTPQPYTDDFGSFTAQFNVSRVPEGTYTVYADDGAHGAFASFRVIPKIILYVTGGPPSTLVFVNGTGFAPHSAVALWFGSFNVTMYPPASTDGNGSFMQLFLVPDVPDGLYTVTARDEDSNSADAPFATPSSILTLTPDTTSGHAVVTAAGSGFPPYAPVLLYVEDVLTLNFIDLMMGNPALFADEYGAYEYSFVVSILKPGDYVVSAYTVGRGFELTLGEALASASLTITEDALLLEISDDIATILIPELGTIKTKLEAINATLISIDGDMVTMNSTLGFIETDLYTIKLKVLSIDGDVATIETTLGTIQGQLESIDGNTATIKTDVGTVKADVSQVTDSQEGFTIPLYTVLAMALVSAACGIILLIMHAYAMRKAPSA